MATTGAVIARIISQYSDKGSKAAQKDIAKLGKNIDAFGKRATRSFALAGTAAVGLASKLAVDAVRGAMEDQKQQAALAVALRNTTGATQEAIEANSRYLDALELQVAIDNKELIPALQKLVTATGNLSRGQELLSLATDVAAASGQDLDTVATALSKAFRGNYTALNKLGLPLDKTAIKAKNFAKIQKDLANISKGQAAAAANTFAGKLTILRLRLAQISEKVGYALIPVFEKLADKIEKEVVPQIETFIRLNQTELVKALESAVKLGEQFVKAIINIGNAVKDFEPLLKIMGSAFFSALIWLKVTGALTAFRMQLGLLIGFMRGASRQVKGFGAIVELNAAGKVPMLTRSLQVLATVVNSVRVAFGLAALTGTAALTAGLGLLVGVIAAAYLGYKGLQYLLDKSAKADAKRAAQKQLDIAAEERSIQRLGSTYVEYVRTLQKTGMQAQTVQDNILAGFKNIEKATAAANAENKKNAADAAREARMAAEQAADEQKKLYIQGLERKGAQKLLTLNRNLLTDKKKMEVQLAAIKAKNAKLDKEGIKLTDPDMMTAIQMEAIYQNLVKTGKVLLAETTKQQKALDDLKIAAAEEYNKSLMRQADIVQNLDKLRQNDIVVIGYLAKKWEMTTEAADMYIKSILAVGDVKIDDAGILAVRMAWGVSEAQARKYLEFTNAINAGHGSIGAEKIKELAKKWYGNSDSAESEARKYEAALIALNDQEINSEEIKAIATAWNMSEDEVAAYLLTVGKPFTLTGDAKLILSADMVAKIAGAWDAARLALLAYLAAAKGFKFDVPGGVPGGFTPGSGNDPAVIAAATAAAEAAAAAAADAADALAESEKALAESTAALESATTLGSIRTATTNEQLNAAVNLATLVGESASDIANAMMVGLLGQGVDAANAASSARYTGQAIAEMQRRQQAAAEEAAARARALESMKTVNREDYYSTRTGDLGGDGFRGAFRSPTSSAGANFGGGNLMAGGSVNVTVNVAGSVTAEQDLVQTVRNGLLAAQYNGNGLLIEAI